MEKQLKPEDVKTEEIDKIIEKSLYGIDDSSGKSLLKLLTFILLFVLYIYLSIIVEVNSIRMIIIVCGLVILVFLFQGTVLPSFKDKKKRNLLEP
jgi:hypothetical protein